ncbi:MAG: hypothetical protein WCQ95_12720 [Bacteroidota bacterium]
MNEKFSFSNSDMFTLLTKANQIVPGIGKIISIHYVAQKQKTEAHILHQPSQPQTMQQVLLDDKIITAIEELRANDFLFQWYAEEDLPFNVNKQKIKQLEVFNELQRNVLLIAIGNEFDKKNDLLFFYFNENISNFAMSNSSKSLSQENKTIIGSLLSNSLNTLLDVVRNDRKTLSNYNHNVNHIISSMKLAQSAVSDFRDKHDMVLLNYANELLGQLSETSGTKFVLEESAIQKIKGYEGNIAELKNVIHNATFFAGNLNIGLNENIVRIEDFHLNFKLAKSIETVQPIHQENTRYQKTISLLDKLEEAAKDVITQKKDLTGSNVGNACKKAISAPAISDALKKHRAKIISLLKEYPDRWSLIRSEFKPLINVLTPKHSHLDIAEKQA